MNSNKNLAKIALIQMTSTSNTESNFSFISSAIFQASQQKALMVFLPENFHYMRSKESFEYQSLSGSIIESYKKLAKINDIWLSLGGFQEKIPDSLKFYNTHIIIDNKGEIQSIYRKIHLFDVDIDTKNSIKESQFVKPGEVTPTVVNSPIGILGLSICYDLRFPELYRYEVLQSKADLLLVPSAFLQTTGKAHWEILLRARAIENTCFVIAAAQSGKHNENRNSYGHSMVVDPWGDILLDMGEEVGVGIVEIDLERIEEIRSKIPCLKHKKLE